MEINSARRDANQRAEFSRAKNDKLGNRAGQQGYRLRRVQGRGRGTTQFDVGTLGMHQDMLARAARFFRDQLKTSKAAIDYLKSRGVTGDTARRFGLGYAPVGPRGLVAVFPNYHVPALVDSGLAINGDHGRFDRFRDRIMFPIHDEAGKIVGFGGRVLEGKNFKYLNSPETPLFDKGGVLYGLPQARESIEAAGTAIVVEGYMDVVMLAQHGITNVVATMGTAITLRQLQKIWTIAKRVVFCFDGDHAGRTAAGRALDACLPFVAVEVDAPHTPVSFMFLQDGHDPDSFVREHGPEAFRKLAGEAITLDVFLLMRLVEGFDLRVADDRARLVHAAGAVLKRIGDPVLHERVSSVLADLTGFTTDEFVALIS